MDDDSANLDRDHGVLPGAAHLPGTKWLRRGGGRSGVRYRRWTVSADVIYMGLGAARNGFDLGYDQWMVEPVVEYEVTKWLSPYVGVRYLSVSGEFRGPLGRDLRASSPGGIPSSAESCQLYRCDLLTQGPQFGGTFHF